MVENGTLIQYFESNLPADGKLWKALQEDAAKLKTQGVTGVWLPPAFKGALGAEDAGYTPYDLYDLGEFKQKGSVRTKYGTKKDYLLAIEALKKNGINVYADVVLARILGADGIEAVQASEFNENSSYQMIGDDKVIGAWSDFKFPGRKGKYSDFSWNWKHFKGIEWDQKKTRELYEKYTGKDAENDPELAKYDYLMGGELNFDNPEVLQEMVRWAVWYIQTTDVDGFRLDSVKEIPSGFFREFLYQVRQLTGKELFAAGDLWSYDTGEISDYLYAVHSGASFFDVKLHDNFYHASKEAGAYDLRRILMGTMVEKDPMHAVTFVDNHETQPGQIYDSWVDDWFKPLAYSLILLRQDGYPCVFYGDLKGVPHDKYRGEKTVLDKLMKLRKLKAYGPQHDYFDDPDCIGWTREGDDEHKDSGLAVILSDGKGGTKRMYIGKQFAGAHFSDVMGNAKYNIKIDENGFGDFYVNRSAVAVWVRKEPK